MIQATHVPAAFEDFAREVVPELQRRGLFRTAYEGRTTRETSASSVPNVVSGAIVCASWPSLHERGAIFARHGRLAGRTDRGCRAARWRRSIGLSTPQARRYSQKGLSVYEAGHIPGARFADLFDAFSAPDAPFPFTRPSAAQLQATARALGIGNATTVHRL